MYLLIPASALLVLAILAIFAWALHGGQFDDLEREGERILDATGGRGIPQHVDDDQAGEGTAPEQ